MFSKIFTPESRFKKLQIRMPDSSDTCGGKPNPQRKSQPRSQGSLLPIGQVGENPGNEVEKKLRIQKYPDRGWPGPKAVDTSPF